jgi:hypothetical protein
MKLVIILFLVTFFVTSCTQSINICQVDEDCVKATCCHPTNAVHKDNAPNCEGFLCTMSCEPETLDCGQGEIKCVENKCIAVIF